MQQVRFLDFVNRSRYNQTLLCSLWSRGKVFLSRTLFASCFFAASCTTVDRLDLGSAEPRWSQRPEEANRLPVGRVVAIFRSDQEFPPQLHKPGAAGVMGQISVQSDPLAAIRSSSRKPIILYRHSIQLRTGAIQDIEIEYTFSIGDCVALRTVSRNKSQVVQLVDALTGQCS